MDWLWVEGVGQKRHSGQRIKLRLGLRSVGPAGGQGKRGRGRGVGGERVRAGVLESEAAEAGDQIKGPSVSSGAQCLPDFKLNDIPGFLREETRKNSAAKQYQHLTQSWTQDEGLRAFCGKVAALPFTQFRLGPVPQHSDFI